MTGDAQAANILSACRCGARRHAAPGRAGLLHRRRPSNAHAVGEGERPDDLEPDGDPTTGSSPTTGRRSQVLVHPPPAAASAQQPVGRTQARRPQHRDRQGSRPRRARVVGRSILPDRAGDASPSSSYSRDGGGAMRPTTSTSPWWRWQRQKAGASLSAASRGPAPLHQHDAAGKLQRRHDEEPAIRSCGCRGRPSAQPASVRAPRRRSAQPGPRRRPAAGRQVASPGGGRAARASMAACSSVFWIARSPAAGRAGQAEAPTASAATETTTAAGTCCAVFTGRRDRAG